MKPGDLVRLIPDEDDEPDRYDGLVGLILRESGEPFDDDLKFFWVMINVRTGWRVAEDRLEVISEAR
jgi:hypothetical protein